MSKYKVHYTTIRRVKIIVFFRTYVIPVLIALTVFAIVVSDSFVFNLVIGGALAIGSLIRMLTGTNKYLTHLHLSDSQLAVQSINASLKTETIKLQLLNVTAVKIMEGSFLFNNPSAVNIKYKNKWMQFSFINRRSRTELQPLLNELARMIHMMHPN